MTRSIQQLPNNVSSTQVVEVATATGFNAGDAVYYKNGDYVSPSVTPSSFANPSGSLSFTASTTLTAPSNYFGGNPAITPVFSYSASSGGGYYGGSVGKNIAPLIAAFQSSTGTSGQFTITVSSNTGIANGQFVTGTGIGAGATVTNVSGTTITLSVANTANLSSVNVTFYSGNYVIAWIANVSITSGQQTNYAYYEIISSSGAQVVAPTQINGSYTNNSNSQIAVCALTGGGFAYVYINTSGGTATKPCYGIISSTGSVVVATVNDTTYGPSTSSNQIPSIAALPNGSFVMVQKNTTFIPYYKIVTANGTVTKAWTSAVMSGITNNPLGLAVRSTGDFIMFDYYASSPNLCFSISNSAGTLITSNATYTSAYTTSATSYAVDVTCLSDGTTFVAAYSGLDGNSYGIVCTIQIPSGNGQVNEIAVPQANTNYTQGQGTFVSVFGISTTGYVLAFSDYFGAIQYIFYSASNVVQSGTNASGALPIITNSTFIPAYGRTTLIETATGVNFYWANSPRSGVQHNTFTMSVNKSTYQVTTPTLSNSFGTVTSSSASTASIPNSNLTSFKYTLNTQETDTFSAPFPTTSNISPTTIVANAVVGSSICTLTTGQFCVAYASSTYAISINVYSTLGVLQRTISVATGSSTATLYFNSFKIVAMASGKFALLYPSATSGVVTLNVYSSAFALTNTLNITPVSLAASFNATVASTAGDLLVVGLAGGISSNTASAYVYSNTLSLLATYESINGANNVGSYMSICGNDYGGFKIVCQGATGTSNYVHASFLQTGATAWTAFGSWASLSSATNGVWYGNQALSYFGSGLYGVVQPTTSGTTSFVYQLLNDTVNSLGYSGSPTSYNPATSPAIAIGQTANGNPVILYENGTANNLTFGTGQASLFVSTGTSFQTFPTSNSTLVTSAYVTTAPGVQPLVAGIGGNFVALVWRNSSGNLVLQITTSITFSTSYVVTTSQASTTSVSINPNIATSTTQITGTLLAGVAATTASAGSTGQLIINGLAQLNSSYPTSAIQNFDFTGLPVDGVKGFVNGRTVNLQGNS